MPTCTARQRVAGRHDVLTWVLRLDGDQREYLLTPAGKNAPLTAAATGHRADDVGSVIALRAGVLRFTALPAETGDWRSPS